VMGDGQVLEQGTHTQLLADPEGSYARLVQAQRLREAEHRDDEFEANFEGEETTEKKQATAIEIAAEKEEPLGRATTSRSLASEILEQRRRGQGSVQEKQYGTRDMFMRMGTINKESIPLYIIGCLAAMCTGMVYPAFGIVYSLAIQDFQMTGHALRVAGELNICRHGR
jgi:ATP-binding cassette subfamily B (MDR/TAP) protein 1